MRGPVQKGIDPELQRQAEYIVNTVKNEQKTGEGLWHHGGTGSGYKNALLDAGVLALINTFLASISYPTEIMNF